MLVLFKAISLYFCTVAFYISTALFSLVYGENNLKFNRSMFNNDLPEIIQITPRDIKKYLLLKESARLEADELGYISEELRQLSVNIEVDVRYRNKSSSSHQGTLELSGRAKDHIQSTEDQNDIIFSLRVKLKTSNINGIKRFRLKLKPVNEIHNEILMGLINEQIGVINPMKYVVRVSILETEYLAMFEQEVDEVLLERFRKRESAIIRVNQNKAWYFKKIQKSPYCRTKQRDKQTEFEERAKRAKDTFTAQYLFQKYCLTDERYPAMPYDTSPQLVNKKFLKTMTNVKITALGFQEFEKQDLRFLRHYEGTGSISRTFKTIRPNSALIRAYFIGNSIFSSHATEALNLNFYYDPFLNELTPIYLDGSDPSFWVDDSRDQCEPDFFHSSEVIADEFEFITGKKLDTGQRCMISHALSVFVKGYETNASNIFEMRRDETSFRLGYRAEELDYKKTSYYDLSFNSGKQKSEICISGENVCTQIDISVLGDIYKKSEYHKNLNLKNNKVWFDFKSVSGINKPNIIISEESGNSISEKIFIPKNHTYLVRDKKIEKSLSFILESPLTSKIVFKDVTFSHLVELKFEAPQHNAKFDKTPARVNIQNLTGCVTFDGARFNDNKLRFSGGGCEDSINILSSTGDLYEVEINNSAFDALDIDFSILNIYNVTISGAGNDCIDLSAGYYNLTNVALSGCADKGISIGERSTVTGANIEIMETGSGVVVKDSSKFFHNGKVNFKNVGHCFETYQKKQHYGNGVIHTREMLLECPVDRLLKRVNVSKVPEKFCEQVSFVSNVIICLKESVISLKRVYPSNPTRQITLHGPEGETLLNWAFDRNKNRECFNNASCELSVPLSFVRELECTNSNPIPLFIGDHIAGRGYFDYKFIRIPCVKKI